MKRTHGMSNTSEFRIWWSMVERCRNPQDKAFASYGGRGITVDPRWATFKQFLTDVGVRPVGMSLERLDNAKGYAPDNCRWATRVEQNNNKRNNTRVTAFGRTQTLAQWAAELHGRLTWGAIQSRLYRGWDAERALSQPTRSYK